MTDTLKAQLHELQAQRAKACAAKIPSLGTIRMIDRRIIELREDEEEQALKELLVWLLRSSCTLSARYRYRKQGQRPNPG